MLIDADRPYLWRSLIVGAVGLILIVRFGFTGSWKRGIAWLRAHLGKRQRAG